MNINSSWYRIVIYSITFFVSEYNKKGNNIIRFLMFHHKQVMCNILFVDLRY